LLYKEYNSISIQRINYNALSYETNPWVFSPFHGFCAPSSPPPPPPPPFAFCTAEFSKARRLRDFTENLAFSDFDRVVERNVKSLFALHPFATVPPICVKDSNVIFLHAAASSVLSERKDNFLFISSHSNFFSSRCAKSAILSRRFNETAEK